MGFEQVAGILQGAVVVLLRVVVALIDFATGPVTAPFGAVEPHLHVFTLRFVVEQPANFDHEGCPVFKAHKSCGEVLYVKLRRWDETPTAEGTFLVGDFCAGDTCDGYGIGVVHKIECEVQDVYANVDTGTAAAVLFLDKARCVWRP